VVGDEVRNRRAQSGIRVERLQSIASVVRNQLLVQVIEADLHAADVQAVDLHATDPRPQVQLTLVSQEMRQRDLALIMSQVGPSIGIELAALAYLEADGDIVSAIVSLVDGSGRRAQLEERLGERMAQLGRRVADSEGGDGVAESNEEWREALHDARRALMEIATQRRAEQLEEQAREADRAMRFRLARETWAAWASSSTRSEAADAPPTRRSVHPEATECGPFATRTARRRAVRSEMEALEEQVEACAIDEGTYNATAMALKDKFARIGPDPPMAGSVPAAQFDAAQEIRNWLDEHRGEEGVD
jgi:NACalpha-BTF3-like transcription factor